MRNFKTLREYFIEYKWKLLAGLITLVIVNVAQLFIPRVIKYAVDDITRGGITQSHLIRYALGIIGLALIVAFFRFFWRYYIFGVVMKIQEKLRNRLFSHLQILGLKFFRDHKVGDLMAHSTNDINAVTRSLRMGIITIVDIIIMGGLAFVFMLLISVKLTFYAIIPLPFLSFVVLRFARLIHRRFERVQASFSSLTAHARENIEGIRVVRGYNQEQGELQKFKLQSQDYVEKNISLIKVWSGFFPLIFLFASLSHGILLWFGGKETILHTISMGDFVAFYSYLGILIWPMIGIGMVTNLLQRGAASMGRINKLLDTQPEIKDAPAPIVSQDGISRINGQLQFINLSFSYNGTDVLKEINLTLKPGDSLGIAGQIGSGKSTLVSLIPRLFEPTDGEIRLDGISIKEIPLSIIRRNITLVPQDTFLFSDTIRANIAFGCSEVSDSEIHRVAKLASIYDEIMQWEGGFDEIAGEKGVTLSGGQCQRIAIARALLVNPRVLILDNALSSVDIEKEAEILQALQQEFRERVLIIVSHRMCSLMGLDRIIVLDEGKIKESGTHEELLRLKGTYFNLFRGQELEEGCI